MLNFLEVYLPDLRGVKLKLAFLEGVLKPFLMGTASSETAFLLSGYQLWTGVLSRLMVRCV